MIKAVLMDYQGVIVDDSAFEIFSIESTCRRLGLPHDVTIYEQFFAGKPLRVAASNYLTFSHRSELLDEFTALKNMFEAEYVEHIDIFPDALFFMDRMKVKHQVAIASFADRGRIEQTVRKAHRGHVIDLIVAAGEFPVNKYETALQHLKLMPEEAVAIEDSPFGIKYARAASIPSIAITRTHPREELSEATVVVDSFDEITDELLEGLIASE